MDRSRLSGTIVLAMTAILLASCEMPAPPCTPSTFDSFPETLDPCSKIIQLQWCAWVETEPVPEFTLLADGSVYYRADQTVVDPYYRGGQTMVAHLKPEEAQALVQSVLDLGFECLEDGEPCVRESLFRVVCLTDQTFWYLEVRLPNGELRGIHDYYGIVDTPAAFERIQNEAISYRHPEAQPYARGAACPSADVECCTDPRNIR